MSESTDRTPRVAESGAAGSAADEDDCTVAVHQPNYLPWLGRNSPNLSVVDPLSNVGVAGTRELLGVASDDG